MYSLELNNIRLVGHAHLEGLIRSCSRQICSGSASTDEVACGVRGNVAEFTILTVDVPGRQHAWFGVVSKERAM